MELRGWGAAGKLYDHFNRSSYVRFGQVGGTCSLDLVVCFYIIIII